MKCIEITIFFLNRGSLCEYVFYKSKQFNLLHLTHYSHKRLVASTVARANFSSKNLSTKLKCVS